MIVNQLIINFYSRRIQLSLSTVPFHRSPMRQWPSYNFENPLACCSRSIEYYLQHFQNPAKNKVAMTAISGRADGTFTTRTGDSGMISSRARSQIIQKSILNFPVWRSVSHHLKWGGSLSLVLFKFRGQALFSNQILYFHFSHGQQESISKI